MSARSGKQLGRRVALHLLLILACLPALFPFIWLVGSSLQRQENVFASPPRWLPQTEVVTLQIDGRPVQVHVVDRNEATGVWRVRFRAAADMPPFRVEEVSHPIALARFHGIEQRVEPVAGPDDDRVRVRVPGRWRRVEAPADAVREQRETLHLLPALRQEIAVDKDARTVIEPGKPVAVAADRLGGTDSGRTVADGSIELPVRTINELPEAGIVIVAVQPGPIRGQVELSELRQRERRRFFYETGGETLECRWLRRPGPEGTGTILVPGELDEIEVAADEIRYETVVEHRATVLGQEIGARPGGESGESWELLDPVLAAEDRFETRVEFDPQWRNYPMALRREPFHLYVLNTLFITTWCVLGNILSCGIVGYAFAKIPFRGRGILFLLLLSTMMVPGQVTMIPTFALFTRLGWLDTYKPLILPAFLAQSAFFVFLYRQFFLSVPLELEDAARVDGAGHLRTFWHIMLPIARPAAVTVGVFSFLAAWNDFLGPLLYVNSDERQTLALGLQNFKNSFGYSDPHYLMAASLLMMLPTLLIFFAAQRAFMRGVVVTGIKG